MKEDVSKSDEELVNRDNFVNSREIVMDEDLVKIN